jgi:hypothetical protein
MFRLTLYVVLVILVVQINTLALSVSGTSGSIDFDGKGTISHMAFPFRTDDVYGGNCIDGTSGLVITVCHPALDTSLIASNIVRAEYLRIEWTTPPSVTFGCTGCASSVHVGLLDLLNFGSSLTEEKTAELQALIDQYGPSAIHMRLSVQGTSSGGNGLVNVFSIARAVNLDLKADGLPNKFNPHSRGVTPLAVLSTQTFDATGIDVSSVRFGRTGHEAPPLRFLLDDADGDGDTDLIVFFNSEESGLECGTLFSYLTGTTLTGQQIAGIDSITTVGCH